MGLLDDEQKDVLDEILPPAEGGEGGGGGAKGKDKDDAPDLAGEPEPSYTTTPDPDSPEALDVKLDE